MKFLTPPSLLPPSLLPLALLGALVIAAPARAGGPTIDATAYLPLGAFNAWEMIDKVLWADGAGIKDSAQVLSVGSTSVVDGVPRYNVKLGTLQGVDDAMLQFSVADGVLTLNGARILDPGADFDIDELSIPAIFFDEPVPVGDSATQLDSDFAVTDITGAIEVKLDLGITSISGDVLVSGTVTSRWNSVAPINTPLGNLGAVGGPLAELQLDFLFTYSSDDDAINNKVDDIVTSKSITLELAPGIGFVQITGKGDALKIVNKVILPGELLSNAGDPDAFPTTVPGDLLSWQLAAPGLVSLDAAIDPVGPDGITDGVVTLNNLQLVQPLGGLLTLTADVSADGAGGAVGPVSLTLAGKATPNHKTGGLKVALSGKTKKLAGFAKSVTFKVKQELAPPFSSSVLNIAWSAGKDPVTKQLITGMLALPITPFVADTVNLTVNLPVDVPKLKGGLLIINPAKHVLGAEGVLTLGTLADGAGPQFPMILHEKVKLKPGKPAVRTYSLVQTGHTNKLFSFTATSSDAQDYALTKLKGKLLGLQIKPLIADVAVTVQ